jgi:hypothetical protein
MAETAKIKIDGREYEFPQYDSLSLDEHQVIYEIAGLTVDQVGQFKDDTFHPGFIKAMVVIAVMRSDLKVSRSEVAERIGKITLPDLNDIFQQAGDDVGPPVKETDVLPEASGGNGMDGLTTSLAPVRPGSSGTRTSDITSTSGPETSVA